MKKLSITALILVAGLLSGVRAAQDVNAQTEGLIQQAREQGANYLSSKDDKAKNAAKKSLEQAEKLLKDGLKRDPNCEKCTEQIVAVYLYQTYFGFSKNYDECLKAANQGLARFPANSRMIFLKGYAHYNSREYAEANKAFTRYLTSASVDPQSLAQVQQILKDSQQRFLTEWNRQANFYQSRESRIEAMNPQTFRMETRFQVTPEWEMSLGSQGFAAITAQAPKLQDPEIQTYLESLITRLVSKSPGPNFNYKVTVINSSEVNAVTPPGHVIVYTGLLAFAENEAQLAGVLAHELAHNYGHHQARAVIKTYLAQGVANAVVSAINPQGQTGQAIAQISSNVGLNLIMKAYSRFEEKEADHYGAHIMYNAGYSPLDASAFFIKMSKAATKQPPKFLSTHPPLIDRADYLADYLESFPMENKEFRTDSEEFRKIKARFTTATQGLPTDPGRGVLPIK
jgi:predicted Zn-dependent protease